MTFTDLALLQPAKITRSLLPDHHPQEMGESTSEFSMRKGDDTFTVKTAVALENVLNDEESFLRINCMYEPSPTQPLEPFGSLSIDLIVISP